MCLSTGKVLNAALKGFRALRPTLCQRKHFECPSQAVLGAMRVHVANNAAITPHNSPQLPRTIVQKGCWGQRGWENGSYKYVFWVHWRAVSLHVLLTPSPLSEQDTLSWRALMHDPSGGVIAPELHLRWPSSPPTTPPVQPASQSAARECHRQLQFINKSIQKINTICRSINSDGIAEQHQCRKNQERWGYDLGFYFSIVSPSIYQMAILSSMNKQIDG